MEIDECFDIEAVAKYLFVSKRHISYLVGKRKIPFAKMSHKILRFRRSDIDKWLTKQMVIPA